MKSHGEKCHEAARCGHCGAVLEKKHVGAEACYCPSCLNFVARLVDGEVPALDRLEHVLADPPEGVSLQRTESGEITIKLRVARYLSRLLVIGPVALFSNFLIAFCHGGTVWAAFSALVFAAVLAFPICRIVTRRITLKSDSLVVDSLLPFFFPMASRRLKRTGQTTIETRVHYNKNGRFIYSVVMWCNGTDRRMVCLVRDEAIARFVAAALEHEVGYGENGLPYLCPICGAPIPGENIDMTEDRLECANCKAYFTTRDASIYRSSLFHLKFKPVGVEETRKGFVYCEGRWLNGKAMRAFAYVGFWWGICVWIGQWVGRISKTYDVVMLVALAISGIVALLYLMWEIVRGRFCVHRIAFDHGRANYFCGIGRFGKTMTFRYHRRSHFCLRAHRPGGVIPRSEIPDGIFAITDESNEERGATYVLFENVSPGFYRWAIARLYLAAAEVDPYENTAVRGFATDK